jgi:glycosyltransferase involved in cell wall biosynthesis
MSASRTAFDIPDQVKPKATRWIVVGAGARDAYQVPIALHDAGLLEQFFTDFYTPLDRIASGRLIPSAIQKHVQRRFAPELPSTKVERSLLYAWRTRRDAAAWMRHSHLLADPASQAARKTGCGIVAYSHVATSAFGNAGDGPKVLLQIQPHPVSVRAALASDSLRPDVIDGAFNELTWPQEAFEIYSREPLLADLCIVASTYTRKTLIENGVQPERIQVIPYGVDLDFFRPPQRTKNKFTVLFAGQIARQKGLHYLLEAWRYLSLPDSELRIAGRVSSENRSFIREYGTQATFLGAFNREQLRAEYQQADLLCLPSLSDGFGHVVLEAMACGTPVLVTASCGASDLISSGQNGFVIPSADLAALSAKLEWAFRHRDELAEMRFAARNTAERYPWSRFRGALVEALQSFSKPHGRLRP